MSQTSRPHHPVVTVESVTYTRHGRFADVSFKPVRLPYAYFRQARAFAPLIGSIRMPARHLHDQVQAGDQVILFVNDDYRPPFCLVASKHFSRFGVGVEGAICLKFPTRFIVEIYPLASANFSFVKLKALWVSLRWCRAG